MRVTRRIDVTTPADVAAELRRQHRRHVRQFRELDRSANARGCDLARLNGRIELLRELATWLSEPIVIPDAPGAARPELN